MMDFLFLLLNDPIASEIGIPLPCAFSPAGIVTSESAALAAVITSSQKQERSQ